MQFHTKQSPADRKNSRRLDQDEAIALKAWHRVDGQTREAIKSNFLPHLLGIYEVCVLLMNLRFLNHMYTLYFELCPSTLLRKVEHGFSGLGNFAAI
jgi:hypothetical protein